MPASSLLKSAVTVALATLLLLLVPLTAMSFTREVNWAPGDFAAAAGLLFGAGMAYVALARRLRTARQRAVAGAGVFVVLAVVWAEAAVGLLG